MKNWLTRGSVAAAVVAAALVTPAAQAATVTVDDARGDVWRVTADDLAPLGETRVNADLVRARVTHGPRLVRAKLTFDELARNRDLRVAQLRLRTPNGRTYDATWSSMQGQPRGAVSFARSRGMDEISCRGLAFDVDYAKETVSFEIPRSCLGRPRWVRAKAMGMASPKGEFEEIYGDVAGTERLLAREWSKRVRIG
jgi:hypothetical protein